MERSQPEKTAIIVAPNGARKTKLDHPALPISITEIVDEVIACQQAGAAMVHLHARDSQGQHSLAIDDNLAVLNAVKEAVGNKIIIQLTTEAVGMYRPEQQIELIKETQPEAASFALQELIPDDSHLDSAGKFFHWVAEKKIISQYILYSPQDLLRYFSLLESGILPKHNHHILLVLGRYHKQMLASPRDLVPYLPHIISTLKRRWAVCAFGRMEQNCLISAMLLQADIRIGFENNHMNNCGLQAKSNAEQVRKFVDMMDLLAMDKHDADSFRTELTR